MTDGTVPALPTDVGEKQTFQIVPTLDGYLELAQRVEHLEANQPAQNSTASPGDVNDDDLAALHDRVDRHRAEIEEIKKRYNALIRYLDATVLTPAQAAAPQDTVQPTARNIIQ